VAASRRHERDALAEAQSSQEAGRKMTILDLSHEHVRALGAPAGAGRPSRDQLGQP